jgi:hypothetical protein
MIVIPARRPPPMSFLSKADDALVAHVFMPVSDALARGGIERDDSAKWAYVAAVALQLISSGVDLASGHSPLFPIMGIVFTVALVVGIAGRSGTRRDGKAMSLRLFVVVVTASGLPLSFASAAIEAAMPAAGGLTADALGALAPTDLLGGLQALVLLLALYLQACADEPGCARDHN